MIAREIRERIQRNLVNYREDFVRFVNYKLQTELDDTKSGYQLIETVMEFEVETRNRFYVFNKKHLTLRNARQQSAHMKRSVYLYRHDVLTVPQLSNYKHDAHTVLLVLKIRLVITIHVRQFFL